MKIITKDRLLRPPKFRKNTIPFRLRIKSILISIIPFYRRIQEAYYSLRLKIKSLPHLLIAGFFIVAAISLIVYQISNPKHTSNDKLLITYNMINMSVFLILIFVWRMIVRSKRTPIQRGSII